MKPNTAVGIGIAGVALLVVSLASVASMNTVKSEAWTPATPPVSADASAANPEARLDASLAARVEVEGQHFNVYVGQGAGQSESDTWSVAIPARR